MSNIGQIILPLSILFPFLLVLAQIFLWPKEVLTNILDMYKI